MHFKVAVRNFHAFNASRWFPHVLVVTIMQWDSGFKDEQSSCTLWLPCAISLCYQNKPLITNSLFSMIATRATTLVVKTTNLFFQCSKFSSRGPKFDAGEVWGTDFQKKMLPTLLRGLSKISQGEYKMLHTARTLIFINHWVVALVADKLQRQWL